MFVLCVVVQYLVYFLVLHLMVKERAKERAGCFTSIVFLMSCGCLCSI